MSKSIQVQASNKLTLQGKLLDVNLGSGKLSDGRPYERATVTLRVTQTYGGKTETSEIPVGMFATQYTSKGDINPAWKSIQEIKQLKTVQNCGNNDADTVRLTGASLQENNFVSRSGQLINGWQIRGSFINKANVPDAASFATEVYIMSMEDEFDREGEITGRMVLKGGIVQYGGKLDVVKFVVENPDTIDYIRRHWEVNKTLTVKGYIRVTSIEVAPSGESSGWGEDVPEGPTTQYIRELVITKGDDEPKEEEFSYDPTEIKKAFNERKAYIEQLQIDARKKANGAAAPAESSAASKKYGWED